MTDSIDEVPGLVAAHKIVTDEFEVVCGQCKAAVDTDDQVRIATLASQADVLTRVAKHLAEAVYKIAAEEQP